MIGLLHPVGPEATGTYWARRAFVTGATVVLVIALPLIITGVGSGSAAEARSAIPSAAYLSANLADPDANGASHTISNRRFVHDSSNSESDADSIVKEIDKDEEVPAHQVGELPSQGPATNPDRQDSASATTPHHVPVVIDQWFRSDMHRARVEEELRAQDRFQQRPDVEHQ